MRLVTSSSDEKNSFLAIETCMKECELGIGNQPDLILVYCTEDHDHQTILKHIRICCPLSRVMGGTTCLGVMSDQGYISNDGTGLGIFAIFDPDGSYGTAICDIGDNPEEAAIQALELALESAERYGETPEFVWITAAPGHEESLIRGLESIIGSDVPIIGGSAADNSVSGNWLQFAQQTISSDSVALAVMFPSFEIAHAFQSGYDATGHQGTVTSVSDRTVHTIDNRPAADVIQDWTGLFEPEQLSNGGNILSQTGLSPIGRKVCSIGDIPFYKLSHPFEITSDKSVGFFTEIKKGEILVQMTGSRENLISRANRVTQAAINEAGFDRDSLAGALLVFCAGCMLTIQDEMPRVVDHFKKSLGDIPFLGVFTFGEQGCFVGHENTHGNLMISVVCFGHKKKG